MKQASKKPLVTILVLNFNGVHFLKKCLPTIKAQTYKNIETIVLDNNSTDKSLVYVKKLKWVKIIQNADNYGYAQANNIGAKKAKGELLLFLNNDTELFPDTIEHMVACYEEKSIIAPMQIVSSFGSKKAGKKSCSMGMDIFGYPYGHMKYPERTKPFYVDGAAFFIGKKDFINLGMFDEKHFIFFEDLDLSWRAQIFGYKIIKCPQAKLYHYSGGTVTGAAKKSKQYKSSYLRRYLNEKNLIRNLLKNYSFPLCIIIPFLVLLMHIVEMLVLLILGKGKAAACYLRAYKWNVLNIKDTLNERKIIQKKRKVSDWQLLKRMYFMIPKIPVLLKYGVPSFS